MSLLNSLLHIDLFKNPNQIIAEYIWIRGSGTDLRSKARTLEGHVSDPAKLPKWNYEGSSTGQATGKDSEIIIYPQAVFKDPIRKGENVMVMCDAYAPAGKPVPANRRKQEGDLQSRSFEMSLGIHHGKKLEVEEFCDNSVEGGVEDGDKSDGEDADACTWRIYI